MQKSPSKISYGDNRSLLSEGKSETSDSDNVSEISVRKKKKYSRYQWETNWEFIRFTLASTVTYESMYALIATGRPTSPNIVHFIVVYIVVGLPICYMQTVMGQYSLLGSTIFKYIAPLSHGVGYSLLIKTYLKCIYFGMLMGDFLLYLLQSISLDWMNCPNYTIDDIGCWGTNTMNKCKKECINADSETSAAVFFKSVFLQRTEWTDTLRLGVPILERTVTSGICWAFVYLILMLGIRRYKKILTYNFYISLVGMLVLLIVCLIAKGAFKGVLLVFFVSTQSLTNFHAWSFACYQVIAVLSLETACHLTYGSYMTPTMPSDILVAATVFFHFLITTVTAMIAHACLGIVMENSKTSMKNVPYIWQYSVVYFSVMPQGLGFLGVPQIWTILYFLILILTQLNYTVAQLDVFERCIADAHPQLRNYRGYIVATFCIIGTLAAVILSASQAYEVREEIFERVLIAAKTFNVFLMCIVVFWIYRVQRLSDDIHFLFGSQSTIFWKVCWYILPILIGGSHFEYTYTNAFFGDHIFFRVIMFIVMISPVPIMAVKEIFNYLKRHNLVGVLQPEERWGPPDPQERHLRHIFNPREEIRSRRRNDSCKHNCFLGSKIMDRALEAEDMYRSGSLEQLEMDYDQDMD